MYFVEAGHAPIAHDVHGAGAVEKRVVVGHAHKAVDVFPVAEQGAQRLMDIQQVAEAFQQVVADPGAVRLALVLVQGGAPHAEQGHFFLFAALPVLQQFQHGPQRGVTGAVIERLRAGGDCGFHHGVPP